MAICAQRGPLLSSWRQNAGLAQWSVRMSEVEFDRIVDAVRKESALAPVVNLPTGLRAFEWRTKATAGDKPASRNHASFARIRRVGEGRKRYR
jgi:hypothetical protein